MRIEYKDISKLLGYEPTVYRGGGHHLSTAGKRTPYIPGIGVIREYQFNRPVNERVGELLEQIGFRTVNVSPEQATEVTLGKRAQIVNNDFRKQQKKYPKLAWYELGVGVSIHYNAYNGIFDKKRGGFSTFHNKRSAYGKKLAQFINEEMAKGTSQINRGLKTNNLAMTRDTYPAYCLVECGFMDMKTEAVRMLDKDFQEECAIEIVRGICRYFGYEYDDLVTIIPEPVKESINKHHDTQRRFMKKMYEQVVEMLSEGMRDEYKLEEISLFLAELLDAAIEDIHSLKQQVEEINYEQKGYKEAN